MKQAANSLIDVFGSVDESLADIEQMKEAMNRMENLMLALVLLTYVSVFCGMFLACAIYCRRRVGRKRDNGRGTIITGAQIDKRDNLYYNMETAKMLPHNASAPTIPHDV